MQVTSTLSLISAFIQECELPDSIGSVAIAIQIESNNTILASDSPPLSLSLSLSLLHLQGLPSV